MGTGGWWLWSQFWLDSSHVRNRLCARVLIDISRFYWFQQPGKTWTKPRRTNFEYVRIQRLHIQIVISFPVGMFPNSWDTVISCNFQAVCNNVALKIFRDGPGPACSFHLVCRRCLRPQKWSPAMRTVCSLPLLMGISVALHVNSQD